MAGDAERTAALDILGLNASASDEDVRATYLSVKQAMGFLPPANERECEEGEEEYEEEDYYEDDYGPFAYGHMDYAGFLQE